VFIVVAGAGIADHVRPASSVCAIAVCAIAGHDEAQGTLPRTQPSVGEANVTDTASKPVGTDATDGGKGALAVADAAAEGPTVGGAEGVPLGLAVATGLGLGEADGVGDSVAAGDGDGDGDAVEIAVGMGEADGLGDVTALVGSDGAAVDEDEQPASSTANRSTTTA
jgi:hypothetical protein